MTAKPSARASSAALNPLRDKPLAEFQPLLVAAVEDGNETLLRAVVAEMRFRQRRTGKKDRSDTRSMSDLITNALRGVGEIRRRSVAPPVPSKPPEPKPAPAPPPPIPAYLLEYQALVAEHENLLRIIMLPAPSPQAQESTSRAHARLAALAKAFADWQQRYPPKLFPWPSTKSDGSGAPGDFARADASPLGRIGYRVGKVAGLPADQRRRLLDWAFANPLPPVESPEYMLGWGPPGTGVRLRRMAEHIAQNGKLRRKAFGSRDQSVEEWQSDLDHLERTHYRRMFEFNWPRTG